MKKSVFITGGSTGIGAAAARRFAAEGWCVAIMDLNDSEGQALAEESSPEAPVIFLHGDVRSKADIAAAFDAAVAAFGRLDCIVANAGIHRRNTLLDVTDDELRLVIDTNIYGTVNTLRIGVPHIIASGGGSVVINSSDQWFVGKPGNFAYGLTKGALGQITRSLSAELGRYGIRVNAVCPGTIHTPLVDKLFERVSARTGVPVGDLLAEEDALFARGAMGRPEEVAAMIYFLASDDAAFCTGGHYLVDGGLVAQ